MIKRVLRKAAIDHGRLKSLWIFFCKPDSTEYAELWRRHGRLFAMGERCHINVRTKILDPAYVSLGNNVALAECTLIGHDGSIGVVGRAENVRLDSVGKVDIRDNVFVGHGAIVLPGVTIGPNAIVGAGSVVTRDVPPNTVVAGNPAKPICTWDEYVAKVGRKTEAYPWSGLIYSRDGDFDPAIEPELVRRRQRHFYPDKVGATS